MVHTRKLTLVGLIAGFSILAIAGGCLSSGTSVGGPLSSGDTVKIGVIAPLTGGAASYGEVVRNTLNLAADKINAVGGINGSKIQLVYEDGQCDGKFGTSAAEKLTSVDKVKFIIGGTCSSETLAAATVTEAAKVLLVSPGSSSPKVSEAGDLVFRTYPSDNGKGKVLAQYAIDQKYKKVGAISEQSDYALGLKGVFEDALKAGGVEVTSETYTKENSDFRTQLLKMKNAEVEAVFVNPQTPDKGLLILNQMKEMGFKAKIMTQEVVGTDTDTLKKAGDFVEGAVTADVLPPEDGGIAAFRADYKAKYAKDLNFESIAAGAYDAMYLLRDAMAAKGDDVDQVKAYLYALTGYKGINGTFGFDKNGDPTLSHALLVIKGAKAVPM